MSDEILKTGIVKFYNTRGYGFIKMEDGQPDYFFHSTNLATGYLMPATGDVVSFTVGQNRKGICAVDVKKIDEK